MESLNSVLETESSEVDKSGIEKAVMAQKLKDAQKEMESLIRKAREIAQQNSNSAKDETGETWELKVKQKFRQIIFLKSFSKIKLNFGKNDFRQFQNLVQLRNFWNITFVGL